MTNRGGKIAICVLVGILALAVFGIVTMALWNWLVPDLFNGPRINIWQAYGLLLLSKILLWGFGGRHYHHGRHAQWKQGLYQKFSSMSPEERAAFKQKMKEKWCRWEQDDSSRNSDVSNG